MKRRIPELARQTGYREETLEKVVRLLGLLAEVRCHPFLSRALVLKGGGNLLGEEEDGGNFKRNLRLPSNLRRLSKTNGGCPTGSSELSRVTR